MNCFRTVPISCRRFLNRENSLPIAGNPFFPAKAPTSDCNGLLLEESGGEYGKEGHVYQQLVEIPAHNGWYPVIGSWVIGGEPAGIGIRETTSRITDNMSHFVPHIIL